MNYKEIAKNRLTCKSVKDGSWTVKGCKTTIQALIDRLAELEEQAEKGTLYTVPVPIGSTVWLFNNRVFTYGSCLKEGEIYEATIQGYRIQFFAKSLKPCVFVNLRVEAENAVTDFCYEAGQIGYTYFITKEEAEKAKRGLKK